MAHIRSLFFNGPLTEVRERAIEAYEKGRPSVITWNITNKCNLLCRHCYIEATHKQKENELSHDEAMELVRQIGKAKVPLVFITGGEPFMRSDLFEIMEGLREHGTDLVMSSNATFISDEYADKLANLGVDYVGVSLYGPEEFHDYYTMVPGTFKRVRAGIERLKRRGITVGIKTIVNAETFPHFYDLIDVCKGIGAALLYACDQVDIGRAAANLQQQRITNDQWRELADFMLEDVLDGDEGMEYDIGAQPSIVAYLSGRLRDRDYDIDDAMAGLRVKTACPVGKGLMTINSEGYLVPCSFVQEYHIGNVREIGLREGVNSLFELGESRVDGRCGSCKYGTICRGCRAKAYFASSNIMGEDPLCMLATV